MSNVELKEHNHMYYSVSTLQEIIDEIKDEHRGVGAVTPLVELVGKINARCPDFMATREAIDTIDDLRAKNKELAMQKALLKTDLSSAYNTIDSKETIIHTLEKQRDNLIKDLSSARNAIDSKETVIHTLEKQCDDLGKELTQLKNCDYYTLEQVRAFVPEHFDITDNALPSEAIYTEGWNACVRIMSDRISMTPPAGHTLSEVVLADKVKELKKLKAEVMTLEERINHYFEAAIKEGKN